MISLNFCFGFGYGPVLRTHRGPFWFNIVIMVIIVINEVHRKGMSAWQLAHFAETTTAKGTKAHEGKAR